MSLINDALKKAQKQRTGEAPPLASMPSVGGQSAASISRSSKPGSGNPLLVPAGIGAGVLVLVVGGYFAFRSSPAAKPVAEKPPAIATASAAQTTPAATPAPIAATPAPANSTPTFTLPIAPKVDPVVAKAETPAPAAPKPVAPVTSQASTPAPSSPPAKLEPRAMTFIENIKVAGIRASATDSKVLMNDRVYRIGDIVEHEMGLKLTGITSNSLTFEDEKGGRFTRTF